MSSQKSIELLIKIKANNEYGWQWSFRLYEYLKLVNDHPTIFNHWSEKYSQKEYLTYVLKGQATLDLIPKESNLYFLRSQTTSILEDENAIQILQEHHKDIVKEALFHLLDNNSPYKEESTTPKSIIDFIAENFFNQKKEIFLDVCSGTGVMLQKAIEDKITNHFIGIEMNPDNYNRSLIKLNLTNNDNYHIINSDAFDSDQIVNKNGIQADYIFCNYPIGLLNDQQIVDLKFGLDKSLPVQKIRRKDYKFISYVYEHLKKDGKAVIVVSGNILFNAVETDIRKHLVENGLIESVIALPENLFEKTSISTYLLVVGFDSKNIKMIDLSSATSSNRRHKNDLDLNKVKLILQDQASTNHRIVEFEEIRQEQFSLIPSLYLRKDKLNLNNLTKLEDIAEVFSGWQVSSQTLNEIFEPNHKDTEKLAQIVQISDIEEGFLEINKNFYKVEKKYIDRFRVEKGDVVISTKSQYVKSAVVDEEIKNNTIASGSIIVIRPNRVMIDSYYLKAFIESQIGQQLLSLRMTGNVIKNLTVNNVKSLDVPIIELEKQKQIGESFILKKQLIEVQKKKINKLQEDIEVLFEFVTEGERDDL
jgi:type I restriction-modification system DNA methylase subunit